MSSSSELQDTIEGSLATASESLIQDESNSETFINSEVTKDTRLTSVVSEDDTEETPESQVSLSI